MMKSSDNDTAFAGTIPQLYDRYMVPLIFEPYAADIASRVAQLQPEQVLELAAGTGAVTRHLARLLPPAVPIVATDLNQSMLDEAAAVGTDRAVTWRQADAQELPFPDGTFDVVVCQFGAMFFPDRAKAYAEARRVLRPGGRFLFNVWDRIAENEFADVVTGALRMRFPSYPPQFLARIPHGYHDPAVIRQDLADGGFAGAPELATVSARSVAESARIPAFAYCQGTPLRSELEARDASRLAEVTELAANAIAERFGTGRVDGKIQAHIVSTRR